MKSVRASAPATVANVSCGFDIFGFAVASPADEVVVTLTDKPGVVIREIFGDDGRLPRDASRNTSSVAVIEFLKAIKSEQGAEITLYKHLALGSGMGSSAASSVAALVAINHLHGEPLSRKELLPFAMESERIACGSAHADNVAPSLLGGFVLIRGYDPLDVTSIPTPAGLFCTLVHPHLELKTEDSRRVLKATIPIKDAITQWGNIAGLVVGLMKPDFGLIGRSLKDVVAEPIRSVLIPGFDRIKEEAVKAGALGCGISGSGPTIFALSTDAATAQRVGEAMQAQFTDLKLKSDVFVSEINNAGAKIL
ncbi:homoserine kinase [Parachryseolinea silvisoli]|jgi:homoserine kinase|uniref:homoserine kinase n=1 Tax=Parachryseolinea silvisoli TaxID=2873601 RepID=UPI002265D239|nr:homoserine kinase [Parachryseolinea silvisoli]MCD9014336.1 homoserine kinase [Parachryseolinea silvisoli]